MKRWRIWVGLERGELWRMVWLGLMVSGVAGTVCQGQDAARLPDAPAHGVVSDAQESKGFFGRWGDFYRKDWKGTATAGEAPLRRGLPQPLDSPPFPSSDWSYGGSPTIGEADGNSYPLMTAILRAKDEGARSRTKIYGWVQPTVNFSTSSDSNAPLANNLYPNRLEMNQFVLYVERLPDSVQREHVDWGFHLTALYGTDYRYTTDKGYFSSQLLVHNRRYGFDPSLEYLDIYVPKVAQGMNIRIGRFISIPGIEAQLSPNNYFSTHSLLYGIDPFTDTGLLFTVQATRQWVVQAGITAGHDVAPWAKGAKPSGTVCASYTTSSVNDNFYLCANGINDGKYGYNNLQQYDGTWYHRFSKTVHMATEAYVMYERDVPRLGGTLATEPGGNGAFCRTGLQSCLAPEYALVSYLNKELSPHTFVGVRGDFLNDKKGQRTGFNTKYSETTLTLSHWVGTTVQIRPEIRFDHAWDRNAYDNGTKQNQFTVATDLIFHF